MRQEVPEAFVPVIKAKISGLSVDLTVACLSLPSIPDGLSLQDGSLMGDLDEKCLRSLGGKYCSISNASTLFSLRTSRASCGGSDFTNGPERCCL